MRAAVSTAFVTRLEPVRLSLGLSWSFTYLPSCVMSSVQMPLPVCILLLYPLKKATKTAGPGLTACPCIFPAHHLWTDSESWAEFPWPTLKSSGRPQHDKHGLERPCPPSVSSVLLNC